MTKRKTTKLTKAQQQGAFGLAQCMASMFGGTAVKTSTGAAVLRPGDLARHFERGTTIMDKELASLRRQHARLTADIRYLEGRFDAESKRKLAAAVNNRARIKAKLDASPNKAKSE